MNRRPPVLRVLSGLLGVSLVCVGLPTPAAEAAEGVVTAPQPTRAGPAAKAAPVAAILPITVQGELAEADRQELTAHLVEGLQRGAFGIVDPDQVARASPAAADCDSGECAKKIAAAAGATHVVRTVVQIVDRDYEVAVTLLDGATGKTLAESSDNCEICGVADVGAMVSTAAATLKNKLDALAQGPATLGVASSPVGSEVRIDGELVGTTPFDGPVIAGKHVLRVSMVGFITVEREVTFVEGVAETLSFDLEKVPSRLPSRPYGYVAIGLGAAALGAATAFAVLDDRPLKVGGTCRDGVDDLGNCRLLWDTDYIVLGSATVGAALVTLGVAILVTSSGRSKGASSKKATDTASLRRRTLRPRVGVGLGSVSVRGRF